MATAHYTDEDFERMKQDPLFTRQYFWRVCAKNRMHSTWERIAKMTDRELMRWVHS